MPRNACSILLNRHWAKEPRGYVRPLIYSSPASTTAVEANRTTGENMRIAATGLNAKINLAAFLVASEVPKMVKRRSNSQLNGWLAPTAHPAHGGTVERPAS